MKVTKALSIDDIYREVKDYDLVFTAEAALADALNNRVEEPRLGKLAYTPRGYVYRRFQNEELLTKKELFLEVINELDVNWKEGEYLLNHVIRAWEETGDPKEVLKDQRFSRDGLESIIQLLRNTKNVYRELERAEVDESHSVCVVSQYQFNELDRSLIPPGFDVLEVFREKKVNLPPFHVYNSANKLVGSLVDNLERLDLEEAAVVVHPDSEYDSLLRTHLRSADLEFQVSGKLQNSEFLRTLIQVGELGLNYPRIKLKGAKPVLSKLGYHLDKSREEEFVPDTTSANSDEINRLLAEAGSSTFAELFSRISESNLEKRKEVREVLEGLNLWGKELTEKRLNNLKYYLDSFDLETDESDTGLLLANPGSVSFIDRSVVFFVGMSAKWDRSVEERPWREVGEIRKRNLRDFKCLLQNGDERLFMVQSGRMNRQITPSTYFNELKPGLSSFTDGNEGEDYLKHERSAPAGSGFRDDYVQKTPEKVEVLSKTDLNQLALSPRDYFFDQLVREPDRDYFRKGTVLHDFAEFYANFPDFVNSRDELEFVELMAERMKSITEESSLAELRTEFRVGMRLIKRYLDGKELNRSSDKDNESYTPGRGENFLAVEFGKKIERAYTEMFFLDKKLGGKGKVDLVNGRELVDYKTGKRKTRGSVVRDSNVDLFKNRPEFQPILYLAYHQKVRENQELKFTFFHLLDDVAGALRDEVELGDLITSVTYYPYKFSEYITSPEAFDSLNSSEKRSRLLDPIGEENFLTALSNLDFDRGDFYSKKKALTHRNQLKSLCRDHVEVGRGKDLTEKQFDKAVTSILKTSLYKLRTKNYFRDDLEAFEEYLESKIERLNRWRRSRFPVGDNDLEEVSHRDLILGGDGR